MTAMPESKSRPRRFIHPEASRQFNLAYPKIKLVLTKLGIYLIDFMIHHGTIALPELRVFSSVGRATALQAVGRRFDPCNTHQVYLLER